MYKQDRAPLFEKMLEHSYQSKGNFHVPGHKQSKAFDPIAKPYFQPILQMDLTEIGELDDLHDPAGVIHEAQQLAAELFGAEDTFFLVGGTTAGIIASILSLCQPNDILIVQRSCHQSVFHGCLLAGARPVYLESDIDLQSGLEIPISPEELERVLENYNEAKAVVITSPSYFGIVQPLKEIKRVCDQFKVPLVVDEAHGAHFSFHPDLPRSAMNCGADISIQSTHKMLTAMTMSSMLHIQGENISRSELKRWLRVIESSSPSYPLMASLDLARRDLALRGRDCIERTLNGLRWLRKKLLNLNCLHEVTMDVVQDPFKFVLRANKTISGYQMADWLAKQGIYSELADHEKVLFCCSYAHDKEDFHNLYVKLKELDKFISDFNSNHVKSWPKFPKRGSSIYSLSDLKRGQNRKRVPLDEAIGQVSTEMVIPYPPGIPLVLPGEIFTYEVVSYLLHIKELGGKIRGVFESFTPEVYVLELNNTSK
ncbi:aminotransferase class I/II-fold pyridoxal phosphate-dependent enzyme [Thermoflavimicrobium daqui]|uniref:Ornithine decarboxylase n=1 Tax=Thermoflavimicrobium daqui TaxID=2137476 RepID=A0A364K2X6_9BACL|nr:aminotransferase class I/II-fold pyridoxal phosphate-dependent enzyme [Thermoflavimicrobium daqui]RAL23154.1 ornithine decarboxylase [Thermoflavimicrobium daqui]